MASDDLGSVPSVALDGLVGGGGDLGLQSPMSDGTIEEDFERALTGNQGASEFQSEVEGSLHRGTGLMKISREDFSDIARHRIIEVVGDDVAGRKIIVVSACRLPLNKGFDHQKFLR